MSRSGPDEATLAAITAAVLPAGTAAGRAADAKRALEVRKVLDVGAALRDCLGFFQKRSLWKAPPPCSTHDGIRVAEKTF